MCACVCLQYACVGLHLYVYADICVYTTRRHQAQFDSVESDWSSRF